MTCCKGEKCEWRGRPACRVRRLDVRNSAFALATDFPTLTSMPPAKNAKSAGLRVGIIRAISTPLGFYVLSLLIVEATIGLVLTASKLSEDHVW